MADLERFEPSISGRIAYEHLHRYALARDYVAGASVLDLACGEGYGAWILAGVAKHVIGIDRDAECIAAAQNRYGTGDHLVFRQGNATEIPVGDGSLDIVVSFETIEHLDDAAAFLTEVKRVLRPAGLLIVSTPNEPEYRRSLAAPNPFHLHEFDLRSLDDLLARFFTDREVRGQRMVIGSSIAPLEMAHMPEEPIYRAYTGDLGGRARPADIHPGITRMAAPEYFLCFCSDATIQHPVAADSFLLMPDEDLWLDHRRIMDWASNLHDETSHLRQQLSELDGELKTSLRKEAAFEELSSFIESARGVLEEDRSAFRYLLQGSNELLAQYETLNRSLVEREQHLRNVEEQAEQRALEKQRFDLERALTMVAPLIARLRKGQANAATLQDVIDVLAQAWCERELADREIASLRGRLGEERDLAQRYHSTLAALTVLENQVDAQKADHARALRDLEVRQNEFASARDQALADMKAEAIERELAHSEEIATLQDALQKSEDAVDALRTEVASLQEQVISNRAESTSGPRPLETSAEDVEKVTYREEISQILLIASREMQSGRANAHLDGQAFAPVDHGEELCEGVLFDERRYRDRYRSLVPDDVDAFRHYMERGWRDGLSPSALFDGDWYLVRNPDAALSGLNPLSHYVRVGAAARAQPHPCFDRDFYEERYPEALRHNADSFQHFARSGLWADCAPSRRIEDLASGDSIAAVLSFVLDEELEPIISVKGWPVTLNDFWMPQGLRDYIGDEFGQGPIDAMSYLLSVIAAYDDKAEEFATSPDLEFLVRRARGFAARPRNSRPDVSIIIPVHNNLVYTLTSIVSILEHKAAHSFEIIVGDDCSTDATAQIVTRLGQTVVLVRHGTNLGFLQNCNECARRAEGRFLVFLNNDTLILPGWLDELVAPLESERGIGMTGSKLINGDGTLQEAGGILWNDGSAWNYGRGSNPRLPHFSYSKDVDYVSGASIAIPATLWEELGGFDPIFEPAYCEDSDLAFRVRATGCRTWLAASSILVHHEGRSHGRDVRAGIKAYQETNQKVFLDRWRETLERDHFPNAESVFLARDHSAHRPHVLIVDHYIPQWNKDAGSRTMLHFIRMFLHQGFHVTFWPDNLNRDREYAKPLQDMGVEIIYGPQYVSGFEAWYEDVADHLPYAFLSRPQFAAKYVEAIDRRRTKILFYGHDLHWKRLEIQWSVARDEVVRREMEEMRALEKRICLACDVALYPSQTEVDFLTGHLPGITAAAVPAWYFDEAEFEVMRERAAASATRDCAHLMFVGGFQHQPNVDGVLWFVAEVWPIVKAANAEAKLTIVGSNAPGDVRALANKAPSVTMAGQISDAALDQLYTQATAAIVPLRFGGGVKGKVIEAFSKAIPVVSTTIGVQGIHAEEICFVADDPEGFARNVLACLDDPSAAGDRVRRAISFLSQHYGLPSLVGSLEPFIPELDAASAPA